MLSHFFYYIENFQNTQNYLNLLKEKNTCLKNKITYIIPLIINKTVMTYTIEAINIEYVIVDLLNYED